MVCKNGPHRGNSSCKNHVPEACFNKLILAKILRTDYRSVRVQAERPVKILLKYSS